MRRILSKQRFWVILIVASFLVNILVAWVTVHKHMDISSAVFSQSSINPVEGGPVSERILWRRVLQESSDCRLIRLRTNTTSNSSATEDVLPPFGSRQNLDRYIEPQDEARQMCYIPSSTSCHVRRYSVVVLSKGTNLRHLFLNLMSFVSYPSVKDITLILDLDKESLSKDSKYGQRILQWNKQRTVKVINEQESLWRAIERFKPNSEAVLWMDGDTRKDWNGTVLKSAMNLWKENSRHLLTSQVNFGDESCSFPRLHGTMMHRNFLCYLDHPVVNSLRNYSAPLGWDVVKNSISILWNHLGSGHIVVPSRVNRTWMTNDQSTKAILHHFGCPCSWHTTHTPSSLSSNSKC